MEAAAGVTAAPRGAAPGPAGSVDRWCPLPFRCRPHPFPPLPSALPQESQEAASAHGWEVVDERNISEYQATGTLYRHRSGAELASFHSDDENKVFGAAFATPAVDSRGAPHVLEHSVLSGSQRFPVKELFAELLKGSLSTYLNALTYPDRTVFPFASTNVQDLKNLMDVYMDVVFHPLFPDDRRIFLQEGWHFEVDEPGQNLTGMSGVVYSEMKGTYSSPDNTIFTYMQTELFPNTSYRFDAGGDPQHIPDLTFEQVLDYYRAHYRPSNARFWFWGDGTVEEERLALLDSYLSAAQAQAQPLKPGQLEAYTAATQPLFKEPVHAVQFYPTGGSQEQGTASDIAVSASSGPAASDGGSSSGSAAPKAYCMVGWVLGPDHWNISTELAASFLDYLLLGTTAAPLHKALIDSGLGEAVIGDGLDTDLRQPVYEVGLKGVDPGSCGEVFDLILSTLDSLASGGFNASAIEAAINGIEFSLRENNTGGFPRGLNQLLRALRFWLYGLDVFEPMQWEGPLEDLKARLAAGEDVFGPLVTSLLLDNPHRVSLELLPDDGLAAERAAEEEARLQAAEQELGPSGVEEVARQQAELEQWQSEPNSPEALAKIPTLQVSDLEKNTIVIPTTASPVPLPAAGTAASTATRLDHNLQTNGIVYLDLALDMRGLPPNLLPLVPLFCSCLTQMGTQRRSFVDLTELIGQKTGGVSASPFVSTWKGKVDDPKAYVLVRGKAVGSKAQDMLDILREILLEPRLDDPERFKQLVLEARASLEQDIVQSGTSFAGSRLDAQRNVAGWVGELMGGVAYLDFVRQLAGQVESNWTGGVLRDLEAIRDYVISSSGEPIINLSADEGLLADVAPGAADLLAALAAGPRQPQAWTGMLPEGNEAFLIPTQVSYTCKSSDIYRDTGYNLTGHMSVLTHFLSTTYLWDSVRVANGAYGASAGFDLTSGMFSYCSYRDPGLLATIEAFDGAPKFLEDNEPSKDDLTKSIVGAIGNIDAYQLPDAKGLTALTRHILNISDAERQGRRNQVLATTYADLLAIAPILEVVAEAGHVASVTSKSQADASLKAQPGFFDLGVRRVL